MTPNDPTVLVWRFTLLPGAETFIRNQTAAHRRWKPMLVGASRQESANSRAEDLVLYSAGRKDRLPLLLFRIFDLSPRLSRLMKARTPAVIHAHFAIDGMRMRRFAKRTKAPLVVTLHGSDITAAPRRPGLRGLRYRRRLRRLFRDAALLVAVSSHIETAALGWGAPRDKLRMIPIGVPWTEPVTVDGRRGVVFIGRLVEKKGIADLIEAWAQLPRPLAESTPLIIIGDGPLRPALEAHAQRTGVNAEFRGFCSPEEVRLAMEGALAVAVPSKTAANGDTEGLPTVVFEAARASTPVVGYAHAGIPEAVISGETGLLAEEGDIVGLRTHLHALLTDQELASRLAKAARARFETHYDIEKQTAKVEALYDQLPRR